MIRINLLPVPKVRKQEALIVQAFIGVAALILIVVGCYFVGLQKKDAIVAATQRNQAKQQQIDELRAQVGEVEKYKKQVQSLEDQLGVIRALERGRTGPVRVMDEMSEIVPRKLWLTNFREAQKKVTIEGLAESGMVIADFLDSIKGSRFFQNATLIVVNSSEQDGNQLQKFTITANVKYDI